MAHGVDAAEQPGAVLHRLEHEPARHRLHRRDRPVDRRLIFGLAPAFQAAKTNLQDSLKDGGRGSAGGARSRLRSTLVVVEIALSLVLLVGASLFVRSFLNLQDARAGFDTAPLMTLRFYMPGDQYEPPTR